MTEQEKREKTIDETREIANVLSASWCRKGKCTENKCDIDECDILTQARVIYDAGYRKEEEVQRETAKQVIDRIVRIFKDFYREASILTLYDVLNHIAYTAEEFGVEV